MFYHIKVFFGFYMACQTGGLMNAKIERRKDNKGRVLQKGESQRKDLTYMYRYTDLDKKRKCIYAKTLNELRLKEDEINKNLVYGIYMSNYTLNDLFEKWLAQNPKAKERTKYKYKTEYDRWIGCKWIGHKRVKDITKSDINLFYIELSKNGLSNGTICACDKYIYNALQMAVEDDYISKNYAKGCVDIYRNTKQRLAMSKDETNKFLRTAESLNFGKNYLFAFKLMLYTGMRVGEITGLTWDDVNLEKRYLDVNHQFVLGDEQSRTAYHIDMPKTEAGKRKVPISNDVYHLLIELKESTYDSAYKWGSNVDGYTGFVIHTRTGLPVLTARLNEYAKEVVKAYNTTHEDKLPNITCHTCRHTFCTRLAEMKISPHALQVIAGHSSYNTTSRIYISVEDDFVNDEFFKVMGESERISTENTD